MKDNTYQLIGVLLMLASGFCMLTLVVYLIKRIVF